MEKYNQNYSSYNPSSSSSTTLEITVLSGEDLRTNRRSVKNSFVTVRSVGGPDCRTTAMDRDGGSYPKWNEKLVVDVAAAAAPVVTLEVRCKTAFGEKLVGTASVPASDFSGGYVPEGQLHFLSYRLRDSRGERSGVINISVRTKSSPAANTCLGSALAAAPTTTAVGVPVGRSGFGGAVVTGVPLWLSHNNNNNNNNGNYF